MFDARALTDFAKEALSEAGLPDEPAASVARGLVEADLLGHSTHGLALLADYVEETVEGRMETSGRPSVVHERGAAATWDARRLPGIWTTQLAIESAVERARRLGLGAIALQRSHHIACLAAFLEAPARQGFAVLVFSSDPGESKVAPFGGVTPVLMPDPIAAGLPAEPDPIMIDISTSITTMGLTNRTKREGGKLPGRWLLSADGQATDDPSVVGAGGTLLPVGGLDHGHKGFGLGLLVEMLTQGLSGYGRADEPSEWGASVLVLAIDPEAFGGRAAFLRQSGFIAQACRDAKPLAREAPVRLPGAAGLGRKRRALAEGVALSREIVSSLTELSRRLGIAMPAERSPAGSRP
jgi:LDH2 family malate/lactate/ureidoglycolate dehydrogenase